jgi:hypothetical protein
MVYYLIFGDSVVGIYAFMAQDFLIIIAISLIYKKISNLTISDERIKVISIAINFLLLTNFVEYNFSQVSCFTSLILLLSTLFLLTKRESISFIFLGLSVVFKSITIFVVPFYLFYDSGFRIKKIKILLYRLIYIIIPMIPSILMFIIYPSLIKSFIIVNTYAVATIGLEIVYIGSITKLLSTIGLNAIISLIIVLFVFYSIAWYIIKKWNISLVEKITLGVLTMMLVSPEFTPSHITIVFATISLWYFSQYKQKNQKILKICFVIMIFSYVIPIGFIVNPLFYIEYIKCLKIKYGFLINAKE